jgi:hypothetical protein
LRPTIDTSVTLAAAWDIDEPENIIRLFAGTV